MTSGNFTKQPASSITYIYISYTLQRSKLHPVTVEYEICQRRHLKLFHTILSLKVENNMEYNKIQEQYNKYRILMMNAASSSESYVYKPVNEMKVQSHYKRFSRDLYYSYERTMILEASLNPCITTSLF